MSDPDASADTRKSKILGVGARRDTLNSRRPVRTNSDDIQFELVLKKQPPGPASQGSLDWDDAGEEEEGQTEILLRPEDGYWLPVDPPAEPVDVSTVSISVRPGRFAEGRQAENDAFVAFEREARVSELQGESPVDSVDALYEDVWERSGADAVLSGTLSGGTPDDRLERQANFFVDDSRSWETMPVQRRAAADEVSDWGGRGLTNGSIAANTMSAARRPQIRAEEVGLERQPLTRAKTLAGPAKANTKDTHSSVQQADLLSRAKELDAELEHYRSENAQLKQMRRQQEGLVAELVQQRSELAKWVADEKAKTVVWCEEQRASVAKERRAVAKQVKDARLASMTLPSRKERAEIESLQATIEKLKLEAEAAARKSRQTERRLQQSLKDQLTAVEEQNQLILALERDKMELLEVLASLGAAMPTMQNKKLAAEVAKRALLHRARYGVDSFVEEVSVEDESLGLIREERSGEVLAVGSELRVSLSNCARSRYAASNGIETHGAPEDEQRSTQYETTAFRPDMGASARPPTQSDREEELHRDGSRTLRYRNGTIKEIYANGDSLVRFTNGDTKRTVNGEVVYFYAEASTTHTTFRDGTERYEFPNGQVESHFSDGRKEILFPDGTRKVVHASGLQESRFVDGVVVREHPGGLREVVTADGQVHHDFGDNLGKVR